MVVMANLTVPIQVNLPDNWIEQVVDRLRNDPDAEWATVVRCKDCKFSEESKIFKDYYACPIMDKNMKPNDFCSYGEEKSDG